MALFRVCRGDEGNLPAAMTDGYAYFCTDTGNFFIDCKDENGSLQRVHINSDYAKHIRYTVDGVYAYIEPNDIMAHFVNYSNPHGVTKEQVDLGNVDNTSDSDKPVSSAQATAIANAKSEVQNNLNAHIEDKSNPHGITATQIGAATTEAINQLSNEIANKIYVPASTTSDNGKFLRVVSGVATWQTVSSAEGVSF